MAEIAPGEFARQNANASRWRTNRKLQRHKKNQRKLRLRHILLLAMRILLIIAICLALARPKLFDVGFNLQNDRPVAAVFVFDTSPSMEYRTNDGQTRLADAQKRGLEMLDELPEGSRFAMLTAYDYAMAKLLDEAGVPVLLVGDSLGIVMLGYPTTLEVTMDDMVHHLKAVSRAQPNALVVGDLPFMTYHLSNEQAPGE